jgi:hypothetical protein
MTTQPNVTIDGGLDGVAVGVVAGSAVPCGQDGTAGVPAGSPDRDPVLCVGEQEPGAMRVWIPRAEDRA